MAARELAASEVEYPRFTVTPAAGEVEIFDLDSHARAREALDFGFAVSGIGFNIFVIGEDRAGRMTATLAYLGEIVAKRAPPSDWIYLNNLRRKANPTPHRLPAGVGRRFRDRLAAVIPKIRDALVAAFSSEAYQARILALREATQRSVGDDLADLRQAAKAQGLVLVQGEDGALRLRRAEDAPVEPASGEHGPGEQDSGEPASGGEHGSGTQSAEGAAERALAVALGRFQLHAVEIQAQLAAHVQELNRGIADEVAGTLLEALVAEFSGFSGLARWLTEMRVDIVEDPIQFRQPAHDDDADEAFEAPEEKYAVNLFVDHGDETHPSVVVESNPTYENLFGRIEYRQAHGTLETDFTLIRAGSLHRANGGILVLRAEALAANATSWAYLKAALRDREIRIEELQRQGSPPVAGAPRPKPIPLDLKVVIVGAPRWYAMFFETDPDFSTYFKIKADIDPDMTATPRNLGIYAGLIGRMARDRQLDGIDAGATTRLLGVAARWAERRDRLTARFELIEDLVTEASVRARQAKQPVLTEELVLAAIEARRRRSARIEDRIVRSILEGAVMIDSAGAAIGQVNGLTVQDVGDRRFGTPVRITARASAGRAGIVNIERDVDLGGPIQQKGAMTLQGFLAGRFGQTRPLSFTCSITFEQSYGGVEGDSASLAELIAVLSDLSQLPIRQDVAMTGSVNQLGQAQAVGGVHWKVEGFFRVCVAQPGGLTGTQGVLVPAANRVNLVLRDELAEAVRAGRFHIWPISSVEDAAELLIGRAAGVPDDSGDYPRDSIFGRAAARLSEFDRILAERMAAGLV